jgi:hypothetical protein
MTWGTNAGPLQVTTVPTFKIVVVVLESDGRQAAPSLHAIPWGIKALAPSQQLQMLKLPSSLCSLLWRTVVLSQALCGCEQQNVRPKQLVPLASSGKATMGPKFPIQVNAWQAQVLMPPPHWATPGAGSHAGAAAVSAPVVQQMAKSLWPSGNCASLGSMMTGRLARTQ